LTCLKTPNGATDEHVEPPLTEEVTETPEEQFFDIDGEQISLTDLRSGFLRQQDYTKKTQSIAEERRVFQENQRDINSLRTEALQSLEALKQQVSAEIRFMEYPDFDFLAESDPAEFIRQQNIWQKREQAVRQIHEAEQHIRAKQAEYEAEQHKAQIQESQSKFYQKYPDLKDSGKSEEVFSEITRYLIDTGFSKEEIQSVSDFRIIDILYQNIQAQKAKTTIPAVVEKMNSKPVLSQKQPSRQATDYRTQSFEKFNNTRSVNDAAALIKNLF
jgi:hypothetical protein